MRISDWSSDVCSSDLTTSERRSARNQLVTALAEHALRTGITDYTGVAELSWLTQVLRFGWQCMTLGRVVREGSRSLAGLDRTSVGWGKSVSVRVDLGGRRIITKKNKT